MVKGNITTQTTHPKRLIAIPPGPPGQAPMISIMGDRRFLVTATLADRESVEALIYMLNMIKDVTPRKADLPTEIYSGGRVGGG